MNKTFINEFRSFASSTINTMDINSLIAQHVIQAHEGGNWTGNSVKETLRDVSVTAATSITVVSENTIASLVHHLTYWNRVIIMRLSGIAVEVPEVNGYDVPTIGTLSEWKQLQADNLVSAHDLASAIRTFDARLLSEPVLPGYSSAYKNLHGCIEHVYYHLGQITMLKRLTNHL